MNWKKGIVYATFTILLTNHMTIHQASAATEEAATVAENMLTDETIQYVPAPVEEIQNHTVEDIVVEEAVSNDELLVLPVDEIVVLPQAPIVLPGQQDELVVLQEDSEEALPLQATNLPQHITTNATYMDALTVHDTTHTYAFTVTGKTKVTWQYKHVEQAQWHHTLYDAQQRVIGEKTINSSSYGLFTTYEKILTPGTYYMEITGNELAMDEHYTFTLTEVLPKMFDDVGQDHPYSDEIGAIQQMGIVTGFENNMFEPETFIQRKHIAAMIMRAEANVRLLSSPQNFVDVPYGHPYYQDIMGLYRSNIIDGKLLEDGVYFEPDAQITRAQLAKILVNAFTIQRADATSYYRDVTTENWFEEAANTLASHGIFFDNTTIFNGDAFVTRAEFAHLLYRAMHVVYE